MFVTDICAVGATLEIEATDPDTGLCHVIALAGPQLAQLAAALAQVRPERAAPTLDTAPAMFPALPPEITTPLQRALYAQLDNVAYVQRAEATLRTVPHTATGRRNNVVLRGALWEAGFAPLTAIHILSAWQQYGGL